MHWLSVFGLKNYKLLWRRLEPVCRVLPRLVMQRSVAMRNTPGMTITHHAFVSRAFLPTETHYASYSPRISSSGAGMG